MSTVQQEVDERTRLTGNNKFELLLFRLGTADGGVAAEVFGINVFKVRELLAMPSVTRVAGANVHILGVINLRGQIIPVIDIASMLGFKSGAEIGTGILLVTEFARSMQAFAVHSVEDIVRLRWDQVMAAEDCSAGSMVTGIARGEEDTGNRLIQVLDVEKILAQIHPISEVLGDPTAVDARHVLPPGTVVLAADDSATARAMIGHGLDALGVPYMMTKTGKEAWERLQAIASAAAAEGKTVHDKIALVLTDLEMPEMDGFTLTRLIKQSPGLKKIPVIVHSSLTGAANEDHARQVGADAYVTKFSPEDLLATIRKVLA